MKFISITTTATSVYVQWNDKHCSEKIFIYSLAKFSRIERIKFKRQQFSDLAASRWKKEHHCDFIQLPLWTLNWLKMQSDKQKHCLFAAWCLGLLKVNEMFRTLSWIKQPYITYTAWRWHIACKPMHRFVITLRSGLTELRINCIQGRKRHLYVIWQLLKQGATAQMRENDRKVKSKAQNSDKGRPRMAVRMQ